MQVTTYKSLPDGTLVFHFYMVLRGIKSEPKHNGEAYGHSEAFTTPEEYFARYPEATFCILSHVEGGELVHGSNHYNRSGYANDYNLTPGGLKRLAAQQAEAEADGSMAKARDMAAATVKAETLPVVTAATHEPVAGENFRRWSKRDLPAIVQAKRRAVALGCEAVILHNLPGEKYGMRWSPARLK